jgi:hypothetical protein
MTMNTIEIFGVVSGVASIVGLIYAIYYAKQSRKIKLLAYDTSASLPLASASAPEKDYTIEILYRRGDSIEQRLRGVHVTFLRFANFGTEPIRREDIAPANPLCVEVTGTRVLDVGLSAVSREVCRIALGDSTEKGICVSFDFLDYRDGALLKILTEGKPKDLRLNGDIIGMPQGLKTTGALRKSSLLTALGVILGGLLFLSSFAGAAWVFHFYVSTWKYLWVHLLPFGAILVPLLIIALVATTIWPGKAPEFADALHAPSWFRRMIHFRFIEGLEHADVITDLTVEDIQEEGEK